MRDLLLLLLLLAAVGEDKLTLDPCTLRRLATRLLEAGCSVKGESRRDLERLLQVLLPPEVPEPP